MGKEGIKILNDVDYITGSIMVSIAGKSREYSAEPADALLLSAGMKEKGWAIAPGQLKWYTSQAFT